MASTPPVYLRRSGTCRQGCKACPCPQACGLDAPLPPYSSRTPRTPKEPMFTTQDVLRAVLISVAVAGFSWLAVVAIVSASSA